MFKLIIPLFLCLVPAMGQGVQKDAEDAYLSGDFQKATQLYRDLVKRSPSQDAFFALGNSAHKSGDNATAVAAFLKARTFAPRNADIAYNLKYTLAKIQDKATAERQLPWYKHPLPHLNKLEYLGALLFLFGVILGAIGVHTYFKSSYSRSSMVIITLLGGLLAGTIVYQGSFPQNWGAIKGEGVPLRSGPGEVNTKLYELSSGVPGLVGESAGDWVEFIMTDGKKAWVRKGNLVAF